MEKLKKKVTIVLMAIMMTMVFFADAQAKAGVIINIQAERGSLQKKQTVIIQVEKNNFV